MRLPVYLDNHATTRVDERVVAAMLPYFTEAYGNAASKSHPYGWTALEAVEHARAQVAQLAGAEQGEVIFTSGATEAINLVLKGIARNKPWSDVRIITWTAEHSAVLDTCHFLESLGADIVRLPVLADGTLDLDLLKTKLDDGASLVSVMSANNEIGTIYPIDEIGRLCKEAGVPLHVDAAQAFGKIPLDFSNGLIDFLSVSGHKLYAPKGVGCLFIKRRIPPLRLTSLIHGGGHESGFRSGTLNVPGIVALGEAAQICRETMAEEWDRITQLRNSLMKQLQSQIPDLQINGTMESRLAGNLNISIPDVEGHLLLPALRDSISVSSGSACTSASTKPSHVLAAIGVSDDLAQASLRFGIGRYNTLEEMAFAANTVTDVVQRLRQNS